MAWSSSGKESIALRQHATLGGRITDTSTQERQQQKSCVDQMHKRIETKCLQSCLLLNAMLLLFIRKYSLIQLLLQYQHHRSRKMISTRALSPRSLRKQYPMLIATVMDMMLNCS
ncbi:uncharacterized protein [Cicer arietinum]|uniref:uncharacterized protein isoform X1 n=1 Tax=Cicer arietinum TaxID=3827 RepID=UPI003CC5E191